MESRLFSNVLRAAVVGDREAVEAILARYMPLFNKHSMVDGKLDEDKRQYIIMRVIMALQKFDPDKYK